MVIDCQHIEEVSLPADGLIDRALFHLIRNAISYSDDDCQVTLTVKSKNVLAVEQQAAVECICFQVSNRSLLPVNETALLLNRAKEPPQQQLKAGEADFTCEPSAYPTATDDALLHKSLSSSKPEGFGLNVVHKVAASLGGSVSCSVSYGGHYVTMTLEVPAIRTCSSSTQSVVMIGAAPPFDKSSKVSTKLLSPLSRSSRKSKKSSNKNRSSSIANDRVLPQIEEPKSRQLTLLVVDDTPSIQKILHRNIESLGHRCVCANHSQHALGIILAADGEQPVLLFDAIIMDLRMPVMDGLTATAEIRKLPGYQSLPIAVLSADTTSSVKTAAIEAGADVFFEKPMSALFLNDYINSLLRSPSQ